MVTIQKNLSPLSSIPKNNWELALKGVKVGLKLGVKLFSAPVAATATALYLQYVVAKSAFTVFSGYAGQYHELEGGYQEVGFSPKEIGTFFEAIGNSENSWDVLKYQFDRENILDVQDLLQKIYDHIQDPNLMQVMTAQVLTKLLVNKNAHFLVEGQEVRIPVINEKGEKKLVTYQLDHKFDLWNKIPAYGFKDKENIASPLLIFRATNTILEEQDTLPTLVANLHPKGPAWKLFSNSEKEIQSWLEQQKESNGEKARLMGYSQGGVLGAYFLTYHPNYFGDKEHQCSYLFDAPGVSKRVALDWEKVEEKPNVKTYVNRGDLIPKIGDSFIGRAFEVRIAQNLKGFQSHQALSLFAPQWKMVEIQIHEENKSKSRSILSAMHKMTGKAIYKPAKTILLPKERLTY